MITPFFINSNIVTSAKEVCSYNEFMDAVAGNTGNSYITYSLIKELGLSLSNIKHIRNIYSYDFQNAQYDLDIINNQCSHVVLVLQDQIREKESYGYRLPFYSLRRFLEKVKCPIVCIGLGANSFNGFDPDFAKKLDGELVSFLRFLSERIQCIGVRGWYTRDVLSALNINNVEVVGCPSYYEKGRDRVVRKKKKEISCKDIIATSFYTIRQINLKRKVSVLMQDHCEDFAIKACVWGDFSVLLTLSQLRVILNGADIFASIPLWQSYLSNYTFAIGTRVHGSICALNSGVIPLCTAGDSRAMEMCEYLHIPHNANVEKKDISKLYNEIDEEYINGKYAVLYDKYNSFFSANFGCDIKNKEKCDDLLIRLPSCNWTIMKLLRRQWRLFRKG